MATPAPDAVKRLVDCFDQNRLAFSEGRTYYNGSLTKSPRSVSRAIGDES